ncbi:hypothetical protein LDENG_00061040 [Lucifuga dentata]|nr:hypothetical protein LDENG_00061040 [Lucifuga dentata]
MRMSLLVALSMSLCWVLIGAAAQSTRMERIEKCGIKCSQGLQCKPKPEYILPPPCKNPPEGFSSSSVFRDVSLSTVMRCEGRQKCSLHLQISTKLQLSESIHGVSMCIVSAGMMERCQTLSFTTASRDKMSEWQVQVKHDCFDISPSQEVLVTVKTFPSYCGIAWTRMYRIPECSSGDLQQHVPECITGQLSYSVNQERKELSVSVSDMLEDKDYYLRLCHKDFICMGAGAHKLIKKEEPVKNATLPYSRPLPCLCIEGFSTATDAPRVQVCPFKDRIEELWFGVTFDPVEETLSWEPACPVAAVVTLCQRGRDGVCVDLPHSSQSVNRKKITFTKVDPHPELCMKFSAGSQSWIRCPFEDGRFQAWEMAVIKQQGQQEVDLLSHKPATFSVGVCAKSGRSHMCQPRHTHTVHVEKHNSVHLTRELCKADSCLQVRRLDVKYAATIIHCFEKCNQSWADWEVSYVIVPAGVCLSAIIFITLVLHLLLTVYQRKRNQTAKKGQSISEKQTDPVPDCLVPVFQSSSILHRDLHSRFTSVWEL